eukprot:Pgem_evm1s1536
MDNTLLKNDISCNAHETSPFFLFKVDQKNGQLSRKKENKNAPCPCSEVVLSDLGIRGIDDDIFHNCYKLSSLDLDRNLLTTLSDALFWPVKGMLETIALSNNRLNKLPNVLNLMPRLKVLLLNYNNLDSIAINTFKNAKLEYFALSSNRLVEFPIHSIENCTSLTELYLRDNLIKTIPKNIFSTLSLSNNLKILDLGKNNMKVIPKEVCKLPKLTKLYLPLNSISVFNDDDLSNCTSLSLLSLADNQIKTISSKSFSTLQNGVLSYNQLKTIPSAIQNLQKLADLHLGSNSLSDINLDGLANLNNLTRLILSNNTLQKIHEQTFRSIKNIKVLALDRNHFKTVPTSIHSCTQLKKLYLSSNSITEISSTSFQNLSYLTELWLSDNQLTHIEKKAFNSTTSLRYLILSRNFLTSVTSTFRYLSNLESLYLKTNRIREIKPNSLPASLGHFELSHNNLLSIPNGTFHPAIALRYLGLTNCSLTGIPGKIL